MARRFLSASIFVVKRCRCPNHACTLPIPHDRWYIMALRVFSQMRSNHPSGAALCLVLRKESMVDVSKNGVDRSKDGKEKALGLAVAQIERQFGKGAIMRLGAQPTAFDIAVISTGAISLDAALGRRRHPARARDRDLRPRGLRQDDDRPAPHRRGAAGGRALRPLSMPSMPLTRCMRRSLASRPTSS